MYLRPWVRGEKGAHPTDRKIFSGTMSISFDNMKSGAGEGKGANEVMINHATLFYDRLSMEFIFDRFCTASLAFNSVALTSYAE